MSEFINTEIDISGQEVIHVSGMYKNWFLDYASYVILERAVPHINDGFKPVQRRILHSLKELDDGRYHKVANIIGHTMKYHPHGDASIGDAMVQIGQKDLLLDMQGNWGNTATGDRAAAPRYIEVRLTPFALDVVFNNKITSWSSSYDGRGKEPITLPVKFPILLAHGVEGIAVGLSTKILPHNFNELIDASIKILKGISPKILPDFPSGGMADFSNYNDGKRGSRVRVRAKIKQVERNLLHITELPYSLNTNSLINSIIKANEKGKIKIRKIEDNTAEHVEISILLPSGISPDKTIDALYRFTDCELSISPLCCVIHENTPIFNGVSELLKISTDHTQDLLYQELIVTLKELENKWHFASLERIFIENRIYHSIEELTNWDEIITTILNKLKPFCNELKKEVSREDAERLTEIKIKRITRFDLEKAINDLNKLEQKILETKHNISNLTEYAIDYFKNLKKKYGNEKTRKTEIKTFESIDATKVVVANKKLYVNREEGFIGTNLKKDEYVGDCSDIDNIIIIRNSGLMQVVKIDSKVFVGKDIIHVAVFKRKDERTIYNMIYNDGNSGYTMIKRFNVSSITRNKDYSLTKSLKGSKILYLTSNPNGEAETVSVLLRKSPKLKSLKFDYNFADLSIKGKGSGGNILSKNSVKRIELKSEGISTLSARKIWFDDNVNRINIDSRGKLLGEFAASDKILTINQKGISELKGFEITSHFDDDMIVIEKFDLQKPITAIYFDGNKKMFFVKRFLLENVSNKFLFISDHKDSYLEFLSTDWRPQIEIIYTKEKGKDRKKDIIDLEKFINIKGAKSIGNKLTSSKIKEIIKLESLEKIIEIQVQDNYSKDEILDIPLQITNNTSDKDDTEGQITLEL
ncbi:MAG: DNA gyrase/topoisomerase IV subunit A [Flavobacteriales bacterium]|jgi:topoisomerase-4 subunit A|nr:DNA gyrase/topoisomerase IV subunit A [Flavobacteriales bacterium]|tara:strand:- start:458 stop:3067 length:2610 start_codon:yes stop_codon:yes gene_type:complete